MATCNGNLFKKEKFYQQETSQGGITKLPCFVAHAVEMKHRGKKALSWVAAGSTLGLKKKKHL